MINKVNVKKKWYKWKSSVTFSWLVNLPKRRCIKIEVDGFSLTLTSVSLIHPHYTTPIPKTSLQVQVTHSNHLSLVISRCFCDLKMLGEWKKWRHEILCSRHSHQPKKKRCRRGHKTWFSRHFFHKRASTPNKKLLILFIAEWSTNSVEQSR